MHAHVLCSLSSSATAAPRDFGCATRVSTSPPVESKQHNLRGNVMHCCIFACIHNMHSPSMRAAYSATKRVRCRAAAPLPPSSHAPLVPTSAHTQLPRCLPVAAAARREPTPARRGRSLATAVPLPCCRSATNAHRATALYQLLYCSTVALHARPLRLYCPPVHDTAVCLKHKLQPMKPPTTAFIFDASPLPPPLSSPP